MNTDILIEYLRRTNNDENGMLEFPRNEPYTEQSMRKLLCDKLNIVSCIDKVKYELNILLVSFLVPSVSPEMFLRVFGYPGCNLAILSQAFLFLTQAKFPASPPLRMRKSVL